MSDINHFIHHKQRRRNERCYREFLHVVGIHCVLLKAVILKNFVIVRKLFE